MRRGKILLVNSGLNTIKAFRNIGAHPLVSINASYLRWYNLWGYDAMIISSTGDTELMAKHSDRLEDYVRNGGVLVCLGVQDPNSQWIPFCQWNRKLPRKPLPIMIESDDESILFKGIDIASLSFHDFFCHGSLIPPQNATPLALSEENQPIMCLIEKDVAGVALVTTLDPDYHLAFGMRSMKTTSDADAENTRKQAQLFLGNVVNWCLWKSAKCNSGKEYFIRKAKGIPSLRFLLAFFILVWLLVLVITIIFLFSGNYHPIVICPGIASILGLLVVLVDKYLGLKE